MLVLCLWVVGGLLNALSADKSGVSPGAISLPKGPGSIEGLGESFQPSLNSGTAHYGIGISVAPGVAGHQPNLKLNYEGGGGNGPLGFGWNLHMPCIQRRTDKGIPNYGLDLGVERQDVFINESKEELVPQADGFFFCKNENAFVRYRFVPSLPGSQQGYWEATTPDGTRMIFGQSASARVQESSTSRIFSWLLEKEISIHGNVIEYSYRSFSNTENLNQKYLAGIRYGPGAPPWSNYHFVVFNYEDRLDWFEDARSGFLVRTGKRMKSIVVGTQGVELSNHVKGDFDGDGRADFLNRRYDLNYVRYAGDASHWSLLESVGLVGADGVSALPAARHRYSLCDPPAELSAAAHRLGTIAEPAAVMDNELVELIDLNADGLPDVLRTQAGGGVHTVWVNRGPVKQPDGSTAILWATPTAVDAGSGAAWGFDLGSDQTHLADMNGDGLADLVRKGNDESVFFFVNRGKLGWGERQEMAVQDSSPPAPFGRDNVRLADMDFDKRSDIIQSVAVGDGVQYRIWFNTGNQRYSRAVVVSPEVGLDFTTPGVQIADCNGDRVPDLYRIRPTSIVAIAGLGYGRFAAPVTIELPDVTLDDTQVRTAKLTDINGDGLADLVLERAAPGECWYWLNLGNYTFTARKRIVDLPPSVSPSATVRWADLNGNGTTDLIYADSQSVPRIQAVELGELLNCGLTPNLLVEIRNGIGRVTRIEYAPSTRYALEDEAAGTPWPDPLPFPVTVVASVTVSDSLGHDYVTQYRYHDGFYDSVEKQFRGFARAEQVEVGDPTAPTLVSQSEFDTGRQFEVMKGRLLRATVKEADGKVFTDAVTQWVQPPKTLMIGTNGEAVAYAHPVTMRKDTVEKGQGEPRRVESEYQYDAFGNQIRSVDYGIVDGLNRSVFDDERVVISEFAVNTNLWILRNPKRRIVQDENGAVIARTECFYDDETFSGNNAGVVVRGDLTLKREWIDPAQDSGFVNTARNRYDNFGNVVALLDPLAVDAGNLTRGHFREVLYDTLFHAYPVRETIHVGDGHPDLVVDAAYDEGLGTMLSSTDFNGNATLYGYDGLSRLTSVTKPHDTVEFPTQEYEYVLAVPAGAGMVNYVETRQLDRVPGSAGSKRGHYMISRQFVDGLGRSLMTRTEAEPVPGQQTPRVAVQSAVLFNARQGIARTVHPFFTLQTGSLEQQLGFENIESAAWKGQFHSNGVLVAIDLAGAHQTLTEYDATSRPVRTINPDGSVSRFEYLPFQTRVFDENDTDAASPHANTPMVRFVDGLGRLIRVDEMTRLKDDGTPSSELVAWTTRYAYDLNDCLTTITDSQENTKLMRYDGLKRKVWANDPDGGVSTNRYDAASNLIESIDSKGQRISYSYDGVNRLLTEDYHDEAFASFSTRRSPDVAYHYDTPAGSVDQGDGTLATARNTKGILAYVEDASGEEHNSYDDRGRVEWSLKRILDPQPANGQTPAAISLVSYRTAFDYDSADRVTRVVFPDNDEVSYQFNARSLLDRIVGGPSGSVISAVQYLPSGLQSRCDYGNGVTTTYAFDHRARLLGLNTLGPVKSGGPRDEYIHFTYDWDAVSNVKQVRDERPTTLIPLNDPRRNAQQFTYDELYRLTQVGYPPAGASPQAPTPFISYRYDRLGNKVAQFSDVSHQEGGRSVNDLGILSYGGAAGTARRVGRDAGSPPGPHALTAISHPNRPDPKRAFSYDAHGNTAEMDGLVCTWDFLHRLVAVEDPVMRAEYTYDYSGRRIRKTVRKKDGKSLAGEPSLATTYVSSYFEVRDNEQPTKFIYNGRTRVARVVGSLSKKNRIQRIRLKAGWNLVSLAVGGSRLSERLKQSGAIASTYAWNSQTLSYDALPAEGVPAGTILWIRALRPVTLGVLGTYDDPVNRELASGKGYLAGTGLEAWTPVFQPSSIVWRPVLQQSSSNSIPTWLAHLGGELAFQDELPHTFAPGEAIYLINDLPLRVEPPPATQRIRFYHPDHLGSAAVMTDASGLLMEETAFYPFGLARHEFRSGSVSEDYKFTQKERDRESGLHYFEARYLMAGLGRFATIDPKFANPDGLDSADGSRFLNDPQMLNLYSYTRNNPVNRLDPTGLDDDDDDELDMWSVISYSAAEVVRTTREDPSARGVASFVIGASDALSWGMGPSYKTLRPIVVAGYNVDTDNVPYKGGYVAGMVVGVAVPGGGVGTTAKTAATGGEAAMTGIIRAGASRTASAPVLGGGGVFARTANAAELAATDVGGTLVTGPGQLARTSANAQLVRAQMYADPYWGPVLRTVEANRALIHEVSTISTGAASDMLHNIMNSVSRVPK